MPQCSSPDDEDNYWDFCPSLPAGILFAVLFGLTTGFHIFQARKYRNVFAWTIIMGGLWETASFSIRGVSIQNQESQALYSTHFILFLLAPLWINAFAYMLLGRMVYFFLRDQKLYRIRAQRMTLYFVGLDIVSFIVQIVGGLMTLSDNIDTLQRGLNIYTAGVALQEFFILCFTFLVVSFQRRLKKEETDDLRLKQAKRLALVTYLALALITIRIIFRLVEFSAGAETAMTKELRDHEVYQYVFDAVPMFFALVVVNVLHPGKVLAGDDSKFTKKTKEQKKKEKADKQAEKAERKAARNGHFESSSEGISTV